jgi:tetratricopeptide (TPR) repeat protein
LKPPPAQAGKNPGGRFPVKRVKPGLKKLALAIEAGKKRDYPRAARILRELISGSEAPAEAWLLLGRSLHALGDYSRALAAFNDYLEQRPLSSQGYLFAGRTCLAVGMPYRAVPLLRKSLEYNPRDYYAMALLGMAYLKSKHSQAAVDVLQAAVEAAPGDKRIYRAYLNALFVRGLRLCRLEDYDLGIQMLRFVLENGEGLGGAADSPLLRLELGRACRETGRFEEALKHYTRALKFAPADRRIRWSRASILMALGKSEEARKEIDKIRAKEPGVPELPWNSELVDLFMIRSFMEAGEWRRAAEACGNWLKLRQGTAMIHSFCAEALRNLRDYKAAHNHILRAEEYAPENIEFRYMDIMVSWEGKDWKALKKALREAGALGGNANLIRRFSILLTVNTSADQKKNLGLLQDAVRTLGPEPELMYALGKANLALGLLDQARSWFCKILSLKPDHEEARLGEIAALEALYAEENDAPETPARLPAEELEKAYNAYLERWPDNFGIRRERALFLVKTCEYAEAAAELEKLLVWEPANLSLRRVLAYAYRKTGRYQDAAVFLKALLREKPRDIGLLLEYSGCLERSGAIQYAVAVLEKALGLFKKSPEICLALGILSFRQKNVEKAFDYLREAAALDTKDPRPYQWMASIARQNSDPGGGGDYEREALKRKNQKKSQ